MLLETLFMLETAPALGLRPNVSPTFAGMGRDETLGAEAAPALASNVSNVSNVCFALPTARVMRRDLPSDGDFQTVIPTSAKVACNAVRRLPSDLGDLGQCSGTVLVRA